MLTLATLSTLFMPATPEPTHVLLLYDTEAIRKMPVQRLVGEYGAWADTLARRDLLTEADALEPGFWVGGPAGSDAEPLSPSGFFLISVPSTDQAVEIARASPHRRHGGWVEVRPLAGRGAGH